MKKTIIASLFFIAVIACGDKKAATSVEVTTPATETEDLASQMEAEGRKAEAAAPQTSFDGINALQIFKQSCAICHGNDGKLGANGAKDLTASAMTLEERIGNITNGKGLMTAFGEILTPEEITAVAKYTFELAKKS